MAADLRDEDGPPSFSHDDVSIYASNTLPTRLDIGDPTETKCFREGAVLKEYYRVGKKRLAPAYPNEVTLKARLDKLKLLMSFERFDRLYVWDDLRDTMDSWDYEDMFDFSASEWIYSGQLLSDPLLRSGAGSSSGEPTASAVGEPAATAAERPPMPNPNPSAGVGIDEQPGRICSWTVEAAETRCARKRQRTQHDK